MSGDFKLSPPPTHPTEWTHGELVRDLYRVRRGVDEIAVMELSLGLYGGGGAMDVGAAKPSWTSFNPTGWEVKRTRSDFLSDLRKEKWKRYLPWVQRFYFAAPKGVAKRDEVPDPAGLMLRGENGWYAVKAPQVMEMDAEHENAFSRALLLGLKRSPGRGFYVDRRHGWRIEKLGEIEDLRRAGAVLGRRVGAVLEQAHETRKAWYRATKRLADLLGEDRPEHPDRDREVDVDADRLVELVEELRRRELPHPMWAWKVGNLSDELTRIQKAALGTGRYEGEEPEERLEVVQKAVREFDRRAEEIERLGRGHEPDDEEAGG